jgi:hypothetical protein
MKVGDLIKELAQHDLEMEVWMGSDSEGNTHSKLRIVEEYVEEDGEMYTLQGGDENVVVVLYP